MFHSSEFVSVVHVKTAGHRLEDWSLTPPVLGLKTAWFVPSRFSSSSLSLLMRASATGVSESTSNGESSRGRSSSGWSQSRLLVGRRLLV